MEKLFNDLESHNLSLQENAKRELTECFASSELKFDFCGFLVFFTTLVKKIF